MSNILFPALPAPYLPKCSLFHYLFPPTSLKTGYEAPDHNGDALIDGLTGRKLTRGQVHHQALRLAGGLRRLGISRGEVACLYGLNSLEWVNALLGCQAARVIVSPASYA